jgi:hypothetical protein
VAVLVLTSSGLGRKVVVLSTNGGGNVAAWVKAKRNIEIAGNRGGTSRCAGRAHRRVGVLGSSGREVDGASLSGNSDAEGNIYLNWTAPAALPQDSWVCSRVRDIGADHGEGARRKVSPTWFQVQ